MVVAKIIVANGSGFAKFASLPATARQKQTTPMKTEVRTKRDSQYGTRTRTTTKPLAFCGLEKRPGGGMAFAMSSVSGRLTSEEPLVICEPWTNGKRICRMGDNSETWIERKSANLATA